MIGKFKKYRKDNAEFPIVLKIQHGGNGYEHELNFGDEVKCVFCGKPIRLDHATVFKYDHPHDDNSKVQCFFCRKIADAVYYADKNNQKRMTDEWIGMPRIRIHPEET